eukprot:66262-Chlamydomonas_euryale.AAC.3
MLQLQATQKPLDSRRTESVARVVAASGSIRSRTYPSPRTMPLTCGSTARLACYCEETSTQTMGWACWKSRLSLCQAAGKPGTGLLCIKFRYTAQAVSKRCLNNNLGKRRPCLWHGRCPREQELRKHTQRLVVRVHRDAVPCSQWELLTERSRTVRKAPTATHGSPPKSDGMRCVHELPCSSLRTCTHPCQGASKRKSGVKRLNASPAAARPALAATHAVALRKRLEKRIEKQLESVAVNAVDRDNAAALASLLAHPAAHGVPDNPPDVPPAARLYVASHARSQYLACCRLNVAASGPSRLTSAHACVHAGLAGCGAQEHATTPWPQDHTCRHVPAVHVPSMQPHAGCKWTGAARAGSHAHQTAVSSRLLQAGSRARQSAAADTKPTKHQLVIQTGGLRAVRLNIRQHCEQTPRQLLASAGTVPHGGRWLRWWRA